MDSQSCNQGGCTVVEQGDGPVSRQTTPVVKPLINYRFQRSSRKMCSLSDLVLALLIILSTTSYTPVLSASISRNVRSTTYQAEQISSLNDYLQEVFEYLYDCHIDNEEMCILQDFRVRRFADPTVAPVNVVVNNLPVALASQIILENESNEILPILHHQLNIYRRVFERIMTDESHVVPVADSFHGKFAHARNSITAMIRHTQQYMDARGFSALAVENYPEFEDTTNSLVFSPRTLHVLIEFKTILTRFESALSRL